MIKVNLFPGSRRNRPKTKTTINVSGQQSAGVPASFVATVKKWLDDLRQQISDTWASAVSIFLRRDIDDTAQGHLTLQGGFTAKKDSTIQAQLSTDSLDVAARAIVRGEAVFSTDGTFADGLTGHGTRIDTHGAEMDTLSLRQFLEVPELRYNRVTVQVGNQWRAPGGGILHSVTPNDDGTGTAVLKLEEGEIGQVAVGDICMGIFHSTTPSDNAAASSDDNHGNFRFAGFFTAYFEVTAVRDHTFRDTGNTYTNGEFSYRLRAVSANYPRQFHPCSAMHFVCYGNRTDTTRQQSRYSTLTYERFLSKVKDYEHGAANIRMQIGDLSRFRPVTGIDFTGYSVYCDSIYMSGYLQQLAEQGDPQPYTYSVDNLADTVPLTATGALKQDLVTTDSQGVQHWLLHSSIQVRRGQELLTYADAGESASGGTFTLSAASDGCTAHFDHATLYIDTVEYQSRPTASVEVTIDCEGRAALTYAFTIKMVRDGLQGASGRDAAEHGTRLRYAISARTTTTTSTTPPDDAQQWTDTPPTPTAAQPYLWMQLTEWTRTDGVTTYAITSSYVRLTGSRGQQGERGEDGLDGHSWTLRGTAAGHVLTIDDLPTGLILDGAVYLVDHGVDGLPTAQRRLSGSWASVTTATGDAYLINGDAWMNTGAAWENVGRIQGEQGAQGTPGANGRTTRIFQSLNDGQQLCDGSAISASGFCFLDFFARRNDSSASGWDVYQCTTAYIYHTGAPLPPQDSDHWQPVSVNAASAFFSVLIARDARLDFLSSNAITVRKPGTATPYAGLGGPFPFWAGEVTAYPAADGSDKSAYTFAVDEQGNLFASSAYLSGTVHATSGAIGGFTISTGALTGTSGHASVILTPSSIAAQSSYSADGLFTVDTASNITAAVSAGTSDSWWTCALQLAASSRDFSGGSAVGTAIDCIEGYTRGLRPEVVAVGGTVTLHEGSDSYNTPGISRAVHRSYSDGQTVPVRPGALILYTPGATVVLPKSPQVGDTYWFMPAQATGALTLQAAGTATITHTGGSISDETGVQKFSTGDHRMVFLVFFGAHWLAKLL